MLPAKSLSTSPDPLHGPTGSSSAIVAAVPGCVIVGSSSHQSDNATTAPALASPPRNPDCVERTDVTTVLPSPEIPVQLGIQPPLSSTKSTTVPGKIKFTPHLGGERKGNMATERKIRHAKITHFLLRLSFTSPLLWGAWLPGDSRRALLESGKALEIRVHRRTDLSGIS